MTDPITCELCGTVNVGTLVRCMACGTELLPGPADRPAVPPEDELDSAAHQATVLEEVPRRLQQGAPTGAADGTAATVRHGDAPDATVDALAQAKRFVVRLLLPDGDRRTVEVGTRPVPLGSALDHLGVTGDPRIAALEGHLYVDEDVLWVEPTADGTGLYRRLRGEEPLVPGDVVLMGDVAAVFTNVPPSPPVDGDRMVLGGTANTPCGRLAFLRRDGTPGPLHDLPAGKTIVGRTDGHLNFPNDSRLSRRHARFFASDRGVTVEDLGSRNGTYVRVRERTQIETGDALRIGAAGLQIRDSA